MHACTQQHGITCNTCTPAKVHSCMPRWWCHACKHECVMCGALLLHSVTAFALQRLSATCETGCTPPPSSHTHTPRGSEAQPHAVALLTTCAHACFSPRSSCCPPTCLRAYVSQCGARVHVAVCCMCACMSQCGTCLYVRRRSGSRLTPHHTPLPRTCGPQPAIPRAAI